MDIIFEADLLGAKPAIVAIEQNYQLTKAMWPSLDDLELYHRLLGRLIYLAFTHSELTYVVHVLSQFMHDPKQEHWEGALHLVRYLKGSPGHGILLNSNNDLSLQEWCDSNWVAYPLTRRSLTGWLVFLSLVIHISLGRLRNNILFLIPLL